MLDPKIEYAKKEIMKLKDMEKNHTDTLEKANSDSLALNEAMASGSSSLNSATELSKVNSRISTTMGLLLGTRSLIAKANKKLHDAITERREVEEAEVESLRQSISNFRKSCQQDLMEVIVQAQILLNLAKGERFGNDLLRAASYLFHNESDSGKPDTYNLLVEKIDKLTKEKFEKSPLGKMSMLEARINSRKDLTVAAEVEKLLSEEHLVNKTQESGA